jgi:ABC-type branched-subunit amino acid transport system substrate-binding protein
MKAVGLKAEIFGTDLCECAAELAPEPDLIDGCVYPDNAVSEDFRTRYRSAFGDEAQLTFAGAAYDMTVLTGDLITAHKPSDGKAFLHLLTQVKDRSGVLGAYSFQDEPEVGRYFHYPVVLKRIAGRRGVEDE